ncbi:MAG: hypothetical protein ACYC2H_03250, partial [Thermoplasmatota archaeon]
MSPAARPAKPAPEASPAWTRVPDETPLDAPDPPRGAHEPFWGSADAGASRILRWAPSRFFQAAAPPEGLPAAVRFAASPLRLAGVFAVLGFFAVFVHQASIELQIVIGAPVFEELVKFGLALLLVGAIPRGRGFALLALLRVAVAWAVGAGFGWLEHLVTYSDEPREILIGRVLFHSGSTALSMAAFCALEVAADVRLRWFATAPATALHYANNVGAVALLALPDVGLLWALGVTSAVYAALVAVPATAPWWRPWVESWVRAHWPLERGPVPEDWADARAPLAMPRV